ncbi:MAG: glycoside hydrolase family 125 protein [Ilumatobacteraceae bacterium]
MPGPPIDDVFPELRARVSAVRFARCAAIVDRFFSRTMLRADDGSPFVITGDIPAMWLRDSTWQVEPFFHSRSPEIGRMLADISRAQTRLVLLDPYANAFNPGPTGNCWHKDFADQSDWVFERKFELDSLASVLRLARRTAECFGVTDHLDANFHAAVEVIIALARREQHHDPGSYVFQRGNGVAHDSLSHDGRGAPTRHTGMVWSAFRPSDDACVFGFHVPSNLFFAHELRHLRNADATSLADDIEAGVATHALTNVGYAYEVDGLGNALFIDDANVPSLLSLPYLGVCATDAPEYLATRRRLLSPQNPWWFAGSALSGVGSQHTPRDHVWPIAVAIEAMTSTNPDDRRAAVELLETTDGGTGFMHESVHVDDPSRFTREWFSWADMTWLDLVLRG